MKLDKFHYHEALHTSNSMCEFIDLSLVQHPVWESAPKDVKDYVVKAQEQLMQYYQWCANEQDKLEDMQ
jgi:hypothetical protein